MPRMPSKSMQTQLTNALRQRERLAQLGEAVAKISHDLRNILSVTTLMADRLEGSADPAVQRATPKILASLTRAVNLTEATLAFGRAEEPPPKLERVRLADIAEDVVENERLTSDGEPDDACITYTCDVPGDLVLRADPEQLHRVLSNLVRNARQAIAATGKPGKIRIEGREKETGWRIEVFDTGPGLPKKALDHLFQPFHGGARKGGSGLGLAIAAEIVRGHGGTLETGADRGGGHDLRHLPAGRSRRLRRLQRPVSPCTACPPALNPRPHAPVAQLDRVLDYESRGRGFRILPGAPPEPTNLLFCLSFHIG